MTPTPSTSTSVGTLPRSDQNGVISALVQALGSVVGDANVHWRREMVRSYEYDGSIDVGHPDAVALVGSCSDVVGVMRTAARFGLPVVARGSGTGLSGGAVPTEGGVALGFSRMRKVVSVDPANLRAVVEPGLVNLDLTKSVSKYGLYFAPDPSSQAACSIGGNVAENAGGAHCLAYGVTTNHVTGLECVLASGEVVHTGSLSKGMPAPDSPGYDLTGCLVGSEGTFAVVTQVAVRLMPVAEAVRTILASFSTIDTASQATSDIIGAGIIPAALEMMDALTIQALTRAGHTGLPADAAAVLLVEVEGLREGVDELVPHVESLLLGAGATEIRTARTGDERDRLWKARKGALGALGQIKPNYVLQDGVIPRTRLLEVLRTVAEVSEKYNLPIANVFHAGDGNLHPCIIFDARVPGEVEKVIAAGGDILRKCVDVGGTLSGEHGIGLEKQAYLTWVMSHQDISAQHSLKYAFDPDVRLNPGKIFPHAYRPVPQQRIA
ncbi:MAG: FAD-binding protein [Chloroflexi bacterium]|nr:MAG: FAD-binding protein [Chloroflexota bacterium]